MLFCKFIPLFYIIISHVVEYLKAKARIHHKRHNTGVQLVHFYSIIERFVHAQRGNLCNALTLHAKS